MSDTPETDAMCICTQNRSFKAIGGVVNSDFARRLERERNEWKAEADRLMELADENFQVTAWKQLIEQEKNRMRGL